MHTQNELEKEGFSYTYSAKEQEELKKIREKYQPQEESKLDRLRRMDEAVTKKATMASILIGTIGALVLGSGMSLCMTDIGMLLGLQQMTCMAAGIAVGIVGIVLVALAYPVYLYILKKEQEKIAPEILRLTEELLK